MFFCLFLLWCDCPPDVRGMEQSEQCMHCVRCLQSGCELKETRVYFLSCALARLRMVRLVYLCFMHAWFLVSVSLLFFPFAPSFFFYPLLSPPPLQVLLPLDTHLVAKPAKCTPSAPAAVAGAQKACKLREATVRSPAHELQQARQGGLRSGRIS